MLLQAQLESVSMKLVGNEACVPKRPSYVADLRKYNLQGNLTLDDANFNTTRKVTIQSAIIIALASKPQGPHVMRINMSCS